MALCKTPTFVLTLPLKCEIWQRDYLDKMFRCGCYVYNNLIQDRLKALRRLENSPEWKQNQEQILSFYKTREKNGEAAELTSAEKKVLYKARNDMLKEAGFTDFSFRSLGGHMRAHYKGLISYSAGQRIGAAVWKSFEKYLYGNGERIHFCRQDDFRSMEGCRNTDTFRFRENTLYVGKKAQIPVKIETDYERDALENRVKFCRIIRKPRDFGWMYMVQIVLEGVPPIKFDHATGEIKHSMGHGRVGIDIGTQTVAVVSDTEAHLEELADKTQKIQDEIRRLLRAMDRSRRATNPWAFNADGTIIPRDKVDPQHLNFRNRRIWEESKRYKAMTARVRALYALQSESRKTQHQEMANRFLALGDEFYIEDMNFAALTRRSKKTEVSEKTGRYKCKKRFGKSIANKSPASFVSTLEQKVVNNGGRFQRINTREAKASQYDHLSQQYNKKKLSQRWNHLETGERVQRDLYSAFLIKNIGEDLKSFDQALCDSTFEQFMGAHNSEVQRLAGVPIKPSSMGIRAAV